LTGLLAVVLAYLIGAIPFGYLVVRFSTGKDVRSSGSGNIGATNVLRTTGRAAGVITLLLDMAKGFGAVWLAAWLTQESTVWSSAAILAVMAGHAFPVFLKFKGGKAVASCVGAFLYVTPLTVLAAAVIFGVAVAVTGYISAGSVLATATFPIGIWLVDHPPTSLLLTAILAAGFIVYRHRPNLERIHAGTENVFRWGRP